MACQTESVILCEPQCWGFEHSTFNAALLQTAFIAYPDAELVFMGEAEHLAAAREVLARAGCPAHERIRWQEIRIPPRTLTGWRRLRSEVAWCRQVLKAVRSVQVKVLLIC